MKAAPVMLAAWAVLELAAPPTSRAHDPGLSSTVATVRAGGVEAVMRFNDDDLPADAVLAPDDVLRVRAGGRDVASDVLERVHLDEGHGELRLFFAVSEPGTLRFDVPLLAALPFGHKHYMEIRLADRLVGARVLSAAAGDVTVDLKSAHPARDVTRGEYAAPVFFVALLFAWAVEARRKATRAT
jgi:hypothetical protein